MGARLSEINVQPPILWQHHQDQYDILWCLDQEMPLNSVDYVHPPQIWDTICYMFCTTLEPNFSKKNAL